MRITAKYISDYAASIAKSQLSPLVGKRITIRGKLQFFGLPSCPGILLDDEEVVCLDRLHAKPNFKDPYQNMYDKRVEATGTLRFFHDSTPMDENMPGAREVDHYHFESETTEVRLFPIKGRVTPPSESLD